MLVLLLVLENGRCLAIRAVKQNHYGGNRIPFSPQKPNKSSTSTTTSTARPPRSLAKRTRPDTSPTAPCTKACSVFVSVGASSDAKRASIARAVPAASAPGASRKDMAAAVRYVLLHAGYEEYRAPGIRARLCALLRDVAGPLRPPQVQLKDEAVATLAGTIYEERAFNRLPALADALEEAGCDNAELLDHLRGPGPHVRGCWAVDLVLGR